MSGKWYRFGNFFKDLEQQPESTFLEILSTTTHDVRYFNLANDAIIRTINIKQERSPRSQDKHAEIYFYISPFQRHQFINAFRAAKIDSAIFAFQGSEYEARIYIGQSPDRIANIIKLFNEINKINANEFSKSFILELTSVLNKSVLLDEKPNHTTPETKIVKSHTNPANKDSVDLYKLIKRMNKNARDNKSYADLYDSFKLMLTKGHNPNQTTADGMTPLFMSLFLNPAITELLLCYGANPFSFSINEKQACTSAIELARTENKIEHFNIMVSAFTRPEKPLNKINQTEMFPSRNQITTIYRFADQRVFTTRLKKLANLSVDEKNSLLAVYKENFKDPKHDTAKLEDNFLKSFASVDNKLVNIIFSNDSKNNTQQIVGAILIELLKPKTTENTLVIHCEYAFLKEGYRGYISMTLETFRLAYAVQLLVPEKVISIFFSSVDYHSYKMVAKNDILHAPKYQSEFTNKLLSIDILPEASGGAITVLHENMTWAVKEEDPIEVIQSESKEYNQDLFDKFFTEHLAGSLKNVYVPILFFVENDSYNAFSWLAKNMGINLSVYISTFALLLNAVNLLSEFIETQSIQNIVAIQSAYLAQHNHLFFLNNRIPSNASMFTKPNLTLRGSL